MHRISWIHSLAGAGVLLVLSVLVLPAPLLGQETRPQATPQSQEDTQKVVSFRPDTPFQQFIQLLNPLFQQETGKRIIDPKGRTMPIGVPISGLHYREAFERVLRAKNLTYEETNTVFLIERASRDGTESSAGSASAAADEDESEDVPATLNTGEIQISAILFDVNLNKVREIGLSWSELIGGSGSDGEGGDDGDTSGEGTGEGTNAQFTVNTKNLFGGLGIIQAPAQIGLQRLIDFFRVLEQEQAGKTIANPQVTVQSGEQGQIQIGQDIPIQTQDFSGNTVTQFFSTGIIVDVTPTLLTEPVADTAGAPEIEFIHLDVRVEDSNTSPSASGPVINRNQATTEVLLLDQEATAIGGLITTQETTSRVGVPVLKDLPPWVLGLRYIFGRETKNKVRRELLIVLRAEVVEPLQARAEDEAEQELLYEQRRRAKEALRDLGGKYEDAEGFPDPDSTGWQ
jgi:type IV pilus assembly protein PilQ